MAGMLVALECYLRRDHEAEWREWERRITVIGNAVASIPGVTAERFIPVIANRVPHLRIRWDPRTVTITRDDAARRLRDGDPSIELVPVPAEDGCLEVASWTLLAGEAEIVARRIREVLGPRDHLSR